MENQKIFIPYIEKLSKKKCGVDWYYAFAPERTIEGAALNESRELPQIVGGYDEKSSLLTQQLFKELTHTITLLPPH